MLVKNNFRWELCPLCGSEKTRLCGGIAYRQPIMFSTFPVQLAITPELFACERCGSWFTQNIVPQNVAVDLYREGESCNKWRRSVPFEMEKSGNIIRRLERYFQKDRSVLDIGCNTGVLLDFARRKGCQTTGIEPSSASLDMLHDKGHVVFSSIDEVTDSYDVITAFDLVEHIYDLPGFFLRAWDLLAEDGVILILTGDIQSISARITRRHWWYVQAPEHIVFPSIKFLSTLSRYKFVSLDKTYASIGYDRPILYGVAQYIKKLLSGTHYAGLPSLGTDHILVTLERSKVV